MISKKNSIILINVIFLCIFSVKSSFDFLEPKNPFAPRHLILINNVSNLIMTQDTLTKQLFDQDTVKNTSAFFKDPCNVISLLVAQPIVDNILSPLFNYIVPDNFFSKICSNEIMVFNARAFLYSGMINTGTFTTKEISFIKPVLSLVTTCLSVLPVHLASRINPALFRQYTYFSYVDFVSLKGIMLLSYLKKTFLLYFQQNEIFLIPNKYTLQNLFNDIQIILNTKKILFCICILLSCLYLKPTNDLFTKPEWWLSIGIAHVMWHKTMVSEESIQNQSSICNLCKENIIPITAAFLHTLYLHCAMTKK